MYHIALEDQPLTVFKIHLKLEKVHGVTNTGSYKNDNACKDFFFDILEYLCAEGVKKKLHIVQSIATNFIWWIDRQQCHRTRAFEPTMKFSEVTMHSHCHHVPGLKQAIFAIFRKHLLESVWNKIVSLLSDGAWQRFSD